MKNKKSALINEHFAVQYKSRKAYFSGTISMQDAPIMLKLPYGRTTLMQLLRQYGLIDIRNMPSHDMLLLGFMKFRTSKKSLDPSALIVPLFTELGLKSLRLYIPEEVLRNTQVSPDKNTATDVFSF